MYWCYIILALIIIFYILKPMPEIRNPRTIYIFVTGVYDSIFRMCEKSARIVSAKKVGRALAGGRHRRRELFDAIFRMCSL